MSQRLTERRTEEGFTLFELLIVIIILAILAAIVAFSVGTSGANALGSACQTDAKAFATALEQYKAQVGSFPPLGPLPPPAPSYTWLTTQQLAAGQMVGPFLRQLPSTSNYQIVTDGNGNVFVYPATTQPNLNPVGMANQSIGGAWNAPHDPNYDTTSLNFATNGGAVCTDKYLNQPDP